MKKVLNMILLVGGIFMIFGGMAYLVATLF